MTKEGAGAFIALGCVGFLVSAPVAAQEPAASPSPKLGGVTVTSTAIDDEAYHAEATGPKAVAPLIDTPRSIVVVPKEVIKETGAATLVEALRTVPGITFGAAEGGNPIGDRPFIRGFDSQGSTFVDGVRDISAQSREIFAVEQIQVVRGSDSTLSGRGSAGGSLNIITKLPEDGDFVSGSASYGTADYKRLTGDVNYKIGDMVGVRLNAMWHDQDVAGRDAIFQKRWGVAPSLTIGLGTPTQLTFAYYHLHTNELPDSGFPYLYTCTATICNAPAGFTLSEPAVGTVTTASGVTGHVPRSAFYGLKERDFRHSNSDQATMRFEHDFGSVKIRNTARFSHNDQAYIYTQPDDQQGNVFGNPLNPIAQPGGQVWRRANTRYGYVESIVNQTDLYGTFKTGGIKHDFSIGAELSLEKARRGTFVTRGFVGSTGNEQLSTGATSALRCAPAQLARFNCTNLFSPTPNDPWVNYTNDASTIAAPIAKSLAIAETQNDDNTQSLYAYDSITVSDAIIVNLGIRWDSFTSKVKPGQPVAAANSFSLKRSDDIFNYQAGVIFKPTAQTSLYAVYATSATPPNSLIGEGLETNSLGTTGGTAAIDLLNSLKVERTKSYEVGGKADLLHEALSLNIALFQTETKNARATSDSNTVAFIGERRVRGFEFGFNGSLTPEWNIFGGYTYLDAKIIDAGFTALTAAAVPGQAAKTVLVPSALNGRPFPQTAKHSFTVWTDYKFPFGLSLGGGAFYSSRVYGNFSDNRSAIQNAGGTVTVIPATKVIGRSVPGYWRLDARIGYRINENLELSANIQNLTDKTYFNQVYTNHYAAIAPGRSAFATLTVKY